MVRARFTAVVALTLIAAGALVLCLSNRDTATTGGVLLMILGIVWSFRCFMERDQR